MFNEKTLLIAVLVVLVIGIFFGLVRAIIGPRHADRVMGINMIGSLSTCSIAVLAVFLKESWLLDICLIYGMISFLAVIVLAKTDIAEKYQEEHHHG